MHVSALVVHDIVSSVSFVANLVNIIVGSFVVYAAYKHRDDLHAFLVVLNSSYANEHIKRIKETLGKLDGLDFNAKENRSEIYALFGQISGQIKLASENEPKLGEIYANIQLVLQRKILLTEPRKRQIIYEIHGVLDNANATMSTSLVGTNK